MIEISDKPVTSSIMDKSKVRVCCNCKSKDTYIEQDGTPHWYNCYCGVKGCTGYICKRCYADPDWRYGNLDPSSATGRGFIGQQIVAKTYGVDDCNLKMNNFHFYVDISKISIHGYCEVKTASLINGMWQFGTEREQIYNTILLLCMDKYWPWKNVDIVYAIPWEEAILHGTGITIYNNPSRATWIDNRKKGFRIDEKPFNDAYHNMKIENCKVLKRNK